MKLLVTPLLSVSCYLFLVAQKTGRRAPATRKPVATTPQTQPTSAPDVATPATRPRPPLNPIPLVVVNGNTITTAEFETAFREQVESVDYKIAEERQEIFELQINTLLLKAEARKRGITLSDFTRWR